jgi:hypothetical protein
VMHGRWPLRGRWKGSRRASELACVTGRKSANFLRGMTVFSPSTCVSQPTCFSSHCEVTVCCRQQARVVNYYNLALVATSTPTT